MTETDLRLLGNILRLARDLASGIDEQAMTICDDEHCECPFCGGERLSGVPLLDALDQFKFRASIAVPE
jgi:hypothetical protein